MITIKVDQGKDIEILLLEHADVIRGAGIQAISESLDLDLDEAMVVEFDVNGDFIDFVLPRSVWLDFLASSIEVLVGNEEYKKLIEVRELMRKLST